MATMAASSVAVSSFSGVTARGEANAKAFSRRRCRVAKATKVRAMSTRSGWEAGKAGMLALGASAVLMGSVGSAMAVEVLMGSDGGELIFSPNELSVAAGETVTFKNNAGFPHNVIFDEEEVPAGVDAASLSMNEEDLLNAPGETYSVKLDKKGTYRFYCSPHQGVGMYGTVTVN